MSASSDPYRLSRDVVPHAYQLQIEPDLDAGRFVGRVSIEIEVVTPTDVIELNAKDLEFTSAAIDGDAVGQVVLDEEHERVRLHTDSPIPAGNHVLDVTYEGAIVDSLYGFYRSTYDGPQGTESLAVTQFQAPHARRAFPCWDEPDRKATFEIAIVCAAGLTAIANGPETARSELDDGRVRFEFGRTIPMSTYLVAWVVGDLEVSEPVVSRGVPIRVVHRPGKSHLSAFALDVAAHALEWFEDYYGIAYPGEKLDLIAVPDFAFGAMENLGCITFREILLLIDPDLASRAELEQAAMVIDHEIAHMWFGDLVTMDWWDGIWLNEAFATLMETKCAADFRPEWDIWTRFAVTTSPAFDTDALRATRAIEYPVHSPDDIDGMFDVLTYEKGAAVLRMLEQWAGPDTFRDGIRTYLDRHRCSNTSANDLWTALSDATGTDVGAVMNTWIGQGGHPLLTVSRTTAGVHLRQQRQSYETDDSVADDRMWQVPVRLVADRDGTIEERGMLLSGRDVDVDLGGSVRWVDANVAGAGFYRTLHKGGLDPLGPGPASLTPAERVVAVDNQFALFLAGMVELRSVIELIRRIAVDENHPQVWRRVASVLNGLFVLSPPEHAELLRLLVAELIAGRWEAWLSAEGSVDASQSLDEAAETAAVILRLGGLWGQGDWAAIASGLVERWDGDPTSVHPDLVGPALDVVGAHGGDAEFAAMVKRWRDAASPQEDLRAQSALACFRDAAMARRFWEMCLLDLRPQDVARAVSSSLSNPATGAACWEFVESHWVDLTGRVPRNSHDSMVSGIRSFSDPRLAERITAFFVDHPLPQCQQTLAQHVERLAVNVAARRRIESELAGSPR